MIDLSSYLVFIAASIAVAIVPGPTVTLIIANSLRHGGRSGLMNIVGTQIGVALMILVLAAGLATIVEWVGHLFSYIKLIGAAYLIYLGIKLWRSNGALVEAAPQSAKSDFGFALQGFFVIWSNPKALLFFGALIPQFLDPTGSLALQTLLLGGTFMLVTTVLDGFYALAASKTGSLLSGRRLCLVERIGGTCLIGGGLWMAFAKRA